MPLIRSSYGSSFLLTTFVIAVLGVGGAEQPFNQANQAEQAKLGKLGTVNFPTSCSQPAQARFLPSGIRWRSRSSASPPKSSRTA